MGRVIQRKKTRITYREGRSAPQIEHVQSLCGSGIAYVPTSTASTNSDKPSTFPNNFDEKKAH